MKRTENNIRIMAENKFNNSGFNIYIEFSGMREYLMFHRHNGMLYNILKDGIYLDELRRWRPNAYLCKSSKRSKVSGYSQLHGTIKHLLLVIDDYLLEWEAC